MRIVITDFDSNTSPARDSKWLCLVVLLSVAALGACAAPLPPAADQAKPPPPPVAIVAPPPEQKPIIAKPVVEKATPEAVKTTPEEDLFFQAMRQIKDQKADKDNYQTARRSFTTLLDKYPNSKWSDVAHIVLDLLGEMDSSGNKLRADQAMLNKLLAEKAKQLQENEQLKKDLRGLHDKYKAEFSTLQQENEQLKKDIQLLKNLEIKLEKREKQLR